MRKKFIALGAFLLICITTPIIAVTISYFISDLKISGISGNLMTGLNITRIEYNGVVANNTHISSNMSASIETITADGITLNNSIISNITNNPEINTNLENINIKGNINYESEHMRFIGKWQAPKYPAQNIDIKYNGKFSLISTGSLGKVEAKTINDRAISWKVANLALSKIVSINKNILPISGHGIYYLNGSGNLMLMEGNNSISATFDNNNLKLKASIPDAGKWNQKLKSINSSIVFNGNNLTSNSTIELGRNKKIEIYSKNQKFQAKYIVNNLVWNINYFLKIRKDFKLSDLRNSAILLKSFGSRFNTFKKVGNSKQVNYSTIEVVGSVPSQFLSDAVALQSSGKIRAKIFFNLLQPDNTKINISTSGLLLANGKDLIKIDSAKIKTAPEKSELKIMGSFNQRPIKVDLAYDKSLTALIYAEKVNIPVSHNVSLIISPKITINNFGNFSNVSGYVNIYGGNIHSNNGGSVVNLPENTTIIGTSYKINYLDWLLTKINGQITLTTIQPIYLENISGLTGDLWGELALKLENHVEPKFTGKVTLKNAKYLKNKKIKVVYAKASYEHNMIDNPMLDIKLSREITKPLFNLSDLSFTDKKEIVGVTVRGSANQPQINPYSNNQNLSKLQIFAAIETGSTSGIGPEQGMLSLFSAIKKDKSPIEALQETLHLDEIYFTTNQDYGKDLINPNLGGSSLVLAKTFYDKIKASYITSLHNKDYLLTATYPITSLIDMQVYSSRYTNPQVARSSENYGFNLLWFKSFR